MHLIRTKIYNYLSLISAQLKHFHQVPVLFALSEIIRFIYIAGLALVNSDHINTYQVINKIKDDKVKEELSQIDWSPALGCGDPNNLSNLL